MDADRFDILTRSLFTAGSRRRALTTLGGALATFELTRHDEADAARSGKCKPACGECQSCDKGKCKRKKNGKKNCKKGTCEPVANGTACSIGICRDGVCIDPNVCTGGTCPTEGGTPCGPGPAGPCLCARSVGATVATCIRQGSEGDVCAAGQCPTGQTCIECPILPICYQLCF